MLNLNYSGGPSKKCRVWILFIHTVCQYFWVVRDTMLSMLQSSWVFSSLFCSRSECCIWNLEVWWYSLFFGSFLLPSRGTTRVFGLFCYTELMIWNSPSSLLTWNLAFWKFQTFWTCLKSSCTCNIEGFLGAWKVCVWFRHWDMPVTYNNPKEHSKLDMSMWIHAKFIKCYQTVNVIWHCCVWRACVSGGVYPLRGMLKTWWQIMISCANSGQGVILHCS